MIALAFGLCALLICFAAYRGLSMMRSDPLDALSEQDRALVRVPVQKQKAQTGPLSRMAERFGREFENILGTGYQNLMTRKIVESGKADYANFSQFMTMKTKLALLGAAPALLLGVFFGYWLAAVGVVLALFFIPDIALWSKASERQEKIEDDLPDFLDVLAVTVSAGLSFRGALERVIDRSEGPLAEEMQLVLRQMDVGESRSEAFSDLRTRNSSKSLDSFVVALLQSEELGAPLTEALNQIALDMRRVTAQRARQKASRANPKISAVVSLIMVPATMLLIGVGMYYTLDFDLGEIFGRLNR